MIILSNCVCENLKNIIMDNQQETNRLYILVGSSETMRDTFNKNEDIVQNY